MTYSLVVSALYVVASHAPLVRPLTVVPSGLDGWIPLTPAATGPYLTYELLLPTFVLLARGLPGFTHALGVALACGLANLALYLAVPTRLAFPTVAPAGTLLALVQRVDTPLCAVPSGHVALPASIALSAMLVARRARPDDASRWRWIAALFGAWALVLAASALLTKQHYVLDVAAGAAFGMATAFTLVRWTGGAGAGADARGAFHLPTIRAVGREWLVVVAVVVVAIRCWTPATALVATVIVATRQHALLALYHDGVHGLVARRRRTNDFVVNAAIGVPLLLPVHLYRAIHLSHHRHLGTAHDPERVLLYRGQPWTYRPLALAQLGKQLVADLLPWNSVRMAWRYMRERRNPRELRLPVTRARPELFAQFAAFAIAWAGAAWVAPVVTARVALIWFGAYLTVTQLLQKVRSFAEHAADGTPDRISYSWAAGVLGRLTIWPYNISHHREHHAHPDVPWNRLPAAFPGVERRPGRELLSHLWSGALA